MRLLRRDRKLDPTVERELAAIDASLAGESVGDDLDELAALVSELRQDRPVPRELFVAELDRRVADGFPPAREHGPEGDAGQSGPTRLTWPSWRVLAPAGAVAASLAVVTVAVVSSGVFSDDGSSTVDRRGDQAPAAGALEQRTERKAAPALGGEQVDDGVIAPPVPPQGSDSDAVRNRQVERYATLTLAAVPNEVEDVADDVVAITDRYRGFVASSDVSGGDVANAGATFSLRLPSERVQAALADLSKLGHVRERTQSTDDITSQFVSVQSRINRLNKERKGLLRQLASADTAAETAAIRTRLRGVDGRLAAARAESKRLRSRVSFSTIDVRIVADASADRGDGKFTPSDALRDARDILGAGLGVLLIALALLVPATLLLTVVWLGVRGLRGRSRERALDAADDR